MVEDHAGFNKGRMAAYQLMRQPLTKKTQA